ncbi:MAG: hypothetical protein NC226_00670 [Bacteroides cellulosilyticus]|nr:hypothetical protein [Bacteroides cellulosilyticus]
MLYSQALDKNYIDVDVDSLACVATDYYGSRGSRNEKALAFYYRGRVYENARKPDSAIVFYNQAEQYVEKTRNEYLKGLIANALAGMYSSQNFHMLAKEKYLEAAARFEHIGHKRNTLMNYAGVIGIFSIFKDYDRMEHYLDLAAPLALELQDQSKLLYFSWVRANLIISRDRDYEEALPILRRAVEQYADGRIPDSYYPCFCILHLEQGQVDSALFYLNKWCDRIEEESPRGRMEILYLQSKIWKSQGNYRQAHDCCEQALRICDSLYFGEKNFGIPELKEKYRSEQLLLQNRYLKKIGFYQILVAMAVLVAILFGAFSLISRRQRKILQQRQEIAEYADAMSRLKKEYEALQTIHQGGRRREAGIDEAVLGRRIAFLKQLLDIASSFKDDKEAFHAKIEALLTKNKSGQTKKGTDEIFLMFQDLMEMRLPGIIGFISDKYPLITDQELALYCMICMGVSKSAACMVLGHKEKTYYNCRNLLRSKLNIINGEMTIPEHFRSMCSEYRCNREI